MKRLSQAPRAIAQALAAHELAVTLWVTAITLTILAAIVVMP